MSHFRMGATPVTWGIWKEYRQSCSVPGKGIKLPDDPGWGYPDDHPVVNVSWEDIMGLGGFCEWATKLAGFTLILPTEAQWEYAARGGTDGLDYPWGNQFDINRLWCDEHMTAEVDRSERIHRNGYGLTDMAGNVLHWCADYFTDEYRPHTYVRGTSWVYCPPTFRCAYRDQFVTDFGLNFIGFRLVTGPK